MSIYDFFFYWFLIASMEGNPDSRIQETFASGIRIQEIICSGNSEFYSLKSRIQNFEKETFEIRDLLRWNLDSSAWNPESTTWDLESKMSWITLHGATSGS